MKINLKKPGKKFYFAALLLSGGLFFADIAFAADDCAQLFGSKGYSCMNTANGTDCQPGHCPGGMDNQCCKPKVSTTGGSVTILGESVDTTSLNGFMQLALAAAKWILGISGSLALAMFVYGGFMLLISQGSSDKIGQAKGIIVGAVVGLFIVFGSYTIIGFVISTMGIENDWSSSNWFDSGKSKIKADPAGTDNQGNDPAAVQSCLQGCMDQTRTCHQTLDPASADYTDCDQIYIDCSANCQ